MRLVKTNGVKNVVKYGVKNDVNKAVRNRVARYNLTRRSTLAHGLLHGLLHVRLHVRLHGLFSTSRCSSRTARVKTDTAHEGRDSYLPPGPASWHTSTDVVAFTAGEIRLAGSAPTLHVPTTG